VVCNVAQWKLTGLLPDDDPQVDVPAAVAVGGVRSDQWFERWQEAKRARSSIMRAGRRRGGAESTAARDRAQWRAWWSDSIGDRLPHALRAEDLTSVIAAMEEAGRAPNYIRTHWVMITSLFNWLVEEEVLAASPIAKVSVGVDPVEGRVREIVVPDFRFIEMLSNRLLGEDRLVFELLLGTGGRRSEVAGIRIADVDLPAKRVWIREPIVEVEGKLVRRRKPKGGHYRAIVVGPQLGPAVEGAVIEAGHARPGRAADPEPPRRRPALEQLPEAHIPPRRGPHAGCQGRGAFEKAHPVPSSTHSCGAVVGRWRLGHRGAADPRASGRGDVQAAVRPSTFWCPGIFGRPG
jgi:integrase